MKIILKYKTRVKKDDWKLTQGASLEEILSDPHIHLKFMINIDLSNQAIQDISPLASCTAITQLYLSNTQVSDISPLDSCTALTTLGLS